jgi:hypothetical protein
MKELCWTAAVPLGMTKLRGPYQGGETGLLSKLYEYRKKNLDVLKFGLGMWDILNTFAGAVELIN